MKAIKRILATIMCLCLVLGCVSVTAFAAESTGSITVENQSGTNATVAGKTLNLFKIFNATSSGENISYQWITETDGTNRYEAFFFGTNGVIGTEVGTIHDVVAYINELKDDSFAFSQMAAKLHTYIHNASITPDKSANVPEGSTSYTFDGLELGYYLIYDATVFDPNSATPAVRSAAMLTHPGENKVIKLKADRPHIEKTVDDSDTATPDWKLGTTASIGETVTFRIVTAIPDHDLYGEDYIFEITDKMADELELVSDSINVTITAPSAADDGSTPANAQTTYEIITDSTKLDAGVDFKIAFNNITELQQNTVIEVIYKAKVTASAAFKNINTATLTYSNDPNAAGSTGSVDATASVLLWQFTLTKYMEDASGTPSFYPFVGRRI